MRTVLLLCLILLGMAVVVTAQMANMWPLFAFGGGKSLRKRSANLLLHNDLILAIMTLPLSYMCYRSASGIRWSKRFFAGWASQQDMKHFYSNST